MRREILNRYDSVTRKLKFTYDRIRSSRLFASYIMITVVLCLLQASGQFLAFRDDNTASSLFTSIIEQAKIPRRFAYLLPNSTILICDEIRGNKSCRIAGSTSETMTPQNATGLPTPPATTIVATPTTLRGSSIAVATTVADTSATPVGLSSSPVETGGSGLTITIFAVPSTTRGGISSSPVSTPNISSLHFSPQPNKRIPEEPVTPPFRYSSRHELKSKLGRGLTQDSSNHAVLHRRGLIIQPQLNPSGDVQSITINGLDGQAQPVTLSIGCVESLAWPDINYRAARREALTLMVLPIWVIAMSVTSVIHNFIPHLAASLLGNCVGVGWTISQALWAEQFFKAYYNAITVKSCDGIELRSFGALHKTKWTIVGAIISGVFLPSLMFLSHKIFRIFWHQTFQRVGANKQVYSSYKLALIFCTSLQLGFFLIPSSLLWLNELLTGVIRKYIGSTVVTHLKILSYMGATILWIVMGSNAVYHERRKILLVFLVLGIGLTIISARTFGNLQYQYTIATWPFFASLSILSFIFLVTSTFLGIVCGLNFGNGLEQHFRVLAELDEAKFVPAVVPRCPEMAQALHPAARHSVVLADILILDRPGSTSSSHDGLDADSLTLSRSSSQLSGNSKGTGVTAMSWSSWLWSRGVAALSPSRTPSPTPKRHHDAKDTLDVPISRFSSFSSIPAGT